MNILQTKPLADSVAFTKSDFIVHLKDGRTLSVPLAWFPTLSSATIKQLKNHEILGDGEGIHWIELDEDLSVMGLLTGQNLRVA
ncbi:MAG: DUF2442 domain-containing protein [Gammaproteobacteria bacterium]|nr:MAG: DUF2442 domain-containing protein [Gammaproteobacteria bacterium]UTW43528.1 DUF2442 domain-containing protein [bacterium SCSIO 12844]